MNNHQSKLLFASTLNLAIALLSVRVSAGEIVPSGETNTFVNQNGNLFKINGGALSLDEQNLFHKFSDFNLYFNEIADFNTNPNLINLLVGVNGGNPSFIDGLIQLTGSNANFFFINPSGIAFGQNSSVNIPSDLYLSTANKIGFSSGQIFDVLGENDYQSLVGNPNAFIFDASQPSGIINEGNLELKNGGNLSIIANGIIHTGTIDAGNVIIQSIPGSSKVKLTPKGSFVSYEIELPRDESGNLKPFTLYDLNEILLANNSVSNRISSDGNGTLQVDAINIPDESGLNILSGNINVSSIDGIGGDIKILGEKVAVIGNSQLDASGVMGGGNINIGGSFQGNGELQNAQTTYIGKQVSISADALNSGNGGDVIVWADDRTDFLGSLSSRGGNEFGNGGFVEISGKNELFFRGDVNLSADNGEIGTVLFDPIDIEISDQPTATFSESGIENGIIANLNFQATNNIIIGNLADNQLSFPRSNVNISFLADSDNSGLGSFLMKSTDRMTAPSLVGSLTGRTLTFSGSSIEIGSISTRSGGDPATFLAPGGTVNINSVGNVTTANIEVFADSGSIVNNASSGDISISANGSIDTSAGILAAGAPEGNPGNIILRARNDIKTSAVLATTVRSGGGTSRSGNITIISENGNIDLNNRSTVPGTLAEFLGSTGISISGGELNTSPGIISIQAKGNIVTNDITSGNGGEVFLESSNSGEIDTSAGTIRIVSSGLLDAGSINFDTGGTVKSGAINDTPDITLFTKKAGDINISANQTILTGNIVALGSDRNGSINISNDVLLKDSLGISGGAININGSLDSLDGTQSLTLSSSETINLLNIIGGDQALAKLDITASQVNINQDLTINGDITFNAPVNIQNPLTINAQASKIFFNDIVRANNNSLVLQANDLDLLGSFTGISTLDIQPFSTNRNLTLGSEVPNTLSLSAIELSLINGFSQVKVGRNDGSGNIAIRNDLTLQDPVVFQTLTGSIIIDGNITGIDDASISLNAPTTFLGADLTTNNQNITINGNTNLGANANVDTGAGAGNIAFNGSITGANQTLNARSGLGETTLGNSALVSNLNLNTASNVNLGGNLTITNPNGTLDFNNPTTLTNNVNITTAGGDITTNNTLNSQVGSNFNLGINPAGGDFTNNGAIGGTQPLGNVVVNNARNIESNAPIEVLSFTINNAQNVALNDDLTANGSDVNITANGDIATTNIASNGGRINLVSDTGNISAGNLNSSNAGGRGGDISIISLRNPNSTITTNNINSSGNIGGNINLQAIETITTNEIFARGTVGNGGNVTIDPVNVVVNFIDAQGGAFGTGGNVDITATEFFRATGGFVDDTGIFSSIATIGGLGSGSITIRHDGGDLFVPFIVGDPSINGTAGALNSGAFTIAPFQVFPGPYYLGNISIITGDRFQNALTQATNIRIPELEPAVELEEIGFFIDEFFTRTYERYFDDNLLAEKQRIKSLNEIKDELRAVEDTTGVKPALIYALFQPQSVQAACARTGEGQDDKEVEETSRESCLKTVFKEKKDDILTLVMVTSDQPTRVETVPSATREVVEEEAELFVVALNNRSNAFSLKYTEPGLKLYNWLINSLVDKETSKIMVDEKPIDNIIFILDNSFGTIPLAAMIKRIEDEKECDPTPHFEDCVEFLIEDYSTGLMPSMSLTEADYKRIDNLKLRISGATTFPDLSNTKDLPFNQLQKEVLPKIWNFSELDLIEEKFTIQNMITNQKEDPNGILHWMTHAKFESDQSKSYVLFADKKLLYSDIRTIKLEDVSLFVLNACETAVGDNDASLGFAGLAYKTQAQSVLGSIWEVGNDSATITMLKFYNEIINPSFFVDTKFRQNITKAQAFQQVQLDMLHGKITIEKDLNDGTFFRFGETSQGAIEAQYDISNICKENDRNSTTGLCDYSSQDYRDPHFWSAFTLVGSPW